MRGRARGSCHLRVAGGHRYLLGTPTGGQQDKVAPGWQVRALGLPRAGPGGPPGPTERVPCSPICPITSTRFQGVTCTLALPWRPPAPGHLLPGPHGRRPASPHPAKPPHRPPAAASKHARPGRQRQRRARPRPARAAPHPAGHRARTPNPASPTLSVRFPLDIRWHGEAGGTEPRPGGRWGPSRGQWPSTVAAPRWPAAEGQLLQPQLPETLTARALGE